METPKTPGDEDGKTRRIVETVVPKDYIFLEEDTAGAYGYRIRYPSPVNSSYPFAGEVQLWERLNRAMDVIQEVRKADPGRLKLSSGLNLEISSILRDERKW
jgi:hypothetical protein